MIKVLQMQRLNIPFRVSFSHAARTRTATETVFVTTELEGGAVGRGEGCPRDYVTGENLDTAFRFFEKYKERLKAIRSVADLMDFAEAHRLEIDENPAAFCAIEMSLLDAFGQQGRKSVEELLGVSTHMRRFQYSAVIGITQGFEKMADEYIALGMKDFKIKLSGHFSEDLKNVGYLQKKVGDGFRLRVDANNLWCDVDEAVDYIARLQMPLLGVEEPLKSRNFSDLKEFSKKSKFRLILDESFKVKDDFDQVVGSDFWIINVRVSKMGGLIRSLRIVEKARKLSVPIIVGAQVGETSYLSKAGMIVANSCGASLLAQEGAFGTYLLEKDIVDNPLQFGKKGFLKYESLPDGYGMGLVFRK
ncbi:MAG: hypothetical protein KDD61_04035 [Bdellovibrionales bacterium]|nr:hypothetical protein [Bdellovibrionales bacterium]